MATILVVDDNPAVGAALEVLFDLEGLHVVLARSPVEALDVLSREDISVVLQDMNFARDTTSGEEGIDLMRAIRRVDPSVPVLLMTAFTSLEMAVRLVKEGATDYIAKPWNDEKLLATVRNLVELRRLSDDNARMSNERAQARRDLAAKFDLCGLVYASAAMHEVVSLAARVAAADVPVLVVGPNGAGKEKIAEILQANSRRKNAPFVRVNAGGLPDTLVDAELFGAETGAYTGASRTRVGRFEEAHGGTLFLDEIGNLSLTGQMKLLRVLQTGEFQRLGASATRKADVRVISATNTDLPGAIRAGTFREDLYFRLNVIELRVPELRDRPDDILLLAEHFLRAPAHARAEGAGARGFSADARDALLAHDWPGNVRELGNRVQRALLVTRGTEITAEDLDLATLGDAPIREGAPVDGAKSATAERVQLERALKDADGVVARAAESLGLTRQAMYRRMGRAGIRLERRIKGPAD
jgi:DNA-binding NtrC family response regulator